MLPRGQRLFRVLWERLQSENPLCNELQRTSAELLSPAGSARFTTGQVNKAPNENESVDVAENPYFAKYEKKLKNMANNSPQEYQERLSELKKHKCEKPKRDEQPPADVPNFSQTKASKKLDDVIKFDLIKDKSTDEIEQIWKEYHQQRDLLYGIVKDEEFDVLMERSKICPLFVYPLPRADGYEFILSQFNNTEVYFTSLQMYQTYKENAPPCLSLVHYPELKRDKGIILMAGTFDDKLLSRPNAIKLIRQMSLYYGQGAGHLLQYISIFNNAPDKFQYSDLIQEYNNMKKFLES